MSRDTKTSTQATTAAPYRTPGLGVVDVVAGDSKDEKSVEEEKKNEGEAKGQEDSELVGGSARQGSRDLPDSRPVNLGDPLMEADSWADGRDLLPP